MICVFGHPSAFTSGGVESALRGPMAAAPLYRNTGLCALRMGTVFERPMPWKSALSNRMYSARDTSGGSGAAVGEKMCRAAASHSAGPSRRIDGDAPKRPEPSSRAAPSPPRPAAPRRARACARLFVFGSGRSLPRGSRHSPRDAVSGERVAAWHRAPKRAALAVVTAAARARVRPIQIGVSPYQLLSQFDIKHRRSPPNQVWVEFLPKPTRCAGALPNDAKEIAVPC